jgi:molybdate/tungstate transport system substrate-binding protein
MRSALRPCLALLVVVVAACGGGADTRGDGATSASGADSAAGDSSALSSAAPFATDGSISVLTMGPLTPALRMVADSFAAREAILVRLDTLPVFDPGVTPSAPAPTADVVAISSAALERRLLANDLASWSLSLARNRVVLAWTDSSRRATELDSASWRRIVLRRDTRVGRVDPAAAPLGVHTLLAMQLAEAHLADRDLAQRLEGASPAARTFASPDSLLAALRAGALDVIWTYESIARAAELRWLNLGPAVDLGDERAGETYMRAAVVLHPEARAGAPGSDAPDSALSAPGGDSLVVRGAPLAYAITIPRGVANLSAAERFVRFLLSPDGQRILRRGTFDLIDPLVVRGVGVPESVALIVDSVVAAAADSARPASPRP